MNEIRIFNANIEEDEPTGEIIIRGVLDQATLRYINMAWYQRERGFSQSHTNEIVGAFFSGGRVPDIVIGMRGNHCTSKDGTWVLRDKCYCIDGGQRLYSAGMALKERPDLKIRLGVKVFVGTTEEFENDLFCTLGTTQVRIAPSVLLRNRKKKSPAADVLVELNNEPRFALKNRIAWDQTKTRHELISGYSFTRVVGMLHAHKGGALRNSKIYDLLDGLDHLVGVIGTESLRNNIIRFFDTVDHCWTIRNLAGGREARPHLKPAFLITLARLLSHYPEFWDGTERNDFHFPDSYIKRLRGFKLSDYARMSNPISADVLYEMLRKQMRLNPSFEEPDAEEEAAA